MKKYPGLILAVMLLETGLAATSGQAPAGAVLGGGRTLSLDEALNQGHFLGWEEDREKQQQKKFFDHPFAGDAGDIVVCTEEGGWPYISNSHVLYYAPAESGQDVCVLYEYIHHLTSPAVDYPIRYEIETSKLHDAIAENRRCGYIQNLLSEN